MHRFFQTLLCCLLGLQLAAQTVPADSSARSYTAQPRYASLVVPAGLLVFGVIGLESHTLKNLNTSTQGEILEHIDERFTIDDFSQHSPMLAVYGLNAAGIQGKHSLAQQTIIIGTAYLVMGATVNILKNTSRVTRPDGSSTKSFPSGHTATAFMGAEFLYQEYKDRSVWYGIAGYAVAAGTGIFRMYNNRHWLTDVAAGAGIGMLSTKIAYLVYPYLQRRIFRHNTAMHGMLMPVVTGRSVGIAVAVNF